MHYLQQFTCGKPPNKVYIASEITPHNSDTYAKHVYEPEQVNYEKLRTITAMMCNIFV